MNDILALGTVLVDVHILGGKGGQLAIVGEVVELLSGTLTFRHIVDEWVLTGITFIIESLSLLLVVGTLVPNIVSANFSLVSRFAYTLAGGDGAVVDLIGNGGTGEIDEGLELVLGLGITQVGEGHHAGISSPLDGLNLFAVEEGDRIALLGVAGEGDSADGSREGVAVGGG